MNQHIVNAAVSTKNFVSRHKIAVTAVATATVCVVVQMKIVKDWNEFLEEKGLLDEYYHMDELD